MKTELTNEEFAQLGKRMTEAWDASAHNQAAWRGFQGEVGRTDICVRWQLVEGGSIHLLLEEHDGAIGALVAKHRNDGSVEPLRRVGWRKTQTGWEELTWD